MRIGAGCRGWFARKWTVKPSSMWPTATQWATCSPVRDTTDGRGPEIPVRRHGAACDPQPAAQHELEVPRFDRLNDLASDGGPKWAQWAYGPQRRSLAALHVHSRIRGLGRVTLTPCWQQVEETRLKARFGAQDREVQEERVDVVGVQVDLDHRLGPWDLAYGAHWDHHRVRSAAWNERRADGQRLDTPAPTRYPNGGAEMGSVSAWRTLAAGIPGTAHGRPVHGAG